MNDLFAFIFFCLIFGCITAAIAQKRNLGSVGGWFLFGALLFIVALLMVIFSKRGLPKAPPGMRAVKARDATLSRTSRRRRQSMSVGSAKLHTPMG